MPQLTFDVPSAQTAQREVSRLEAQYGVSLAEFEKTILPDAISLAVHEDYNDWHFWAEVLLGIGEVERLQRISMRSDGNE